MSLPNPESRTATGDTCRPANGGNARTAPHILLTTPEARAADLLRDAPRMFKAGSNAV